MSGLRARLLAGTGANALGLGVTVFTQLAALPLFLSHWDAATYGVWLMLSAVPAYLAMADVGMVTAAGNRMTMAMGAGDMHEANGVFHSAQLFVLLVCSLAALLVLPLVLWAPWPGGDAAGRSDERQALLLLCTGVLLAFVGGLSDQRFRATRRYALGTFLGNAVRLGEWLGWIAGLLLVGSYTAVASGGLLLRALGTVAMMLCAARGADGLSWGVAHARWSRVRELWRPAVGFMAFPVANAVGLQGITLLVGGLLGPAAVAVFNTYRTLARTAVQVNGLVSHALWPEFSHLKGQRDGTRLARLARTGTLATGALALLIGVTLYLIGPHLLAGWTRGAIAWMPLPFALLMAYAVVAGLWHVPRIVLSATNQHGAVAACTLAASLGTVLLCAMLAGQGITGVALGMLIGELCIAVAAMALAWQALAPRWPVAGEAP